VSRLSFGEYILDRRKSEIYYQDKPLELEPQIYGILELLITRHGEIGSAQRWIKTYPNRGYKFIGELGRVDETASPADPVSPPAVISSSSQPEPDTIKLEQPSSKSSFILQKSKALKVAAIAALGVFGFYVLSQTTRSSITQAPPVSYANDEAAIYRLASSDDPNALPRLAVLPFETIGDKSDYEYLPEILKSEVSNKITAIDGITVVGLSSGSAFEKGPKNYDILKEEFDLDYVIAAKMLPYGKAFKLNVSLVDVEGRNVLFNEPFDLDISNEDSLEDLPALIARKITLMTANKLSLSVDQMPRSWANYDFYKKYEEASEISASRPENE